MTTLNLLLRVGATTGTSHGSYGPAGSVGVSSYYQYSAFYIDKLLQISLITNLGKELHVLFTVNFTCWSINYMCYATHMSSEMLGISSLAHVIHQDAISKPFMLSCCSFDVFY